MGRCISLLVVALFALATSSGCSRDMATRHGADGSSDAAPPRRCDARDLPNIKWPLEGTVSRDFAVINYMDDDPSPGVRDFMGHVGEDAITYDGHDGVDIAIGGFGTMDRGIPVFAGVDGVVESAEDGAPDRNRADTSAEVKAHANDVVIRAANGYLFNYWHLRKDSVRVRAGDRVHVGEKLGEVGSSGRSDCPHVHLAAYDCTGHAIDMMGRGMFADPPPYDAPRGLMDVQISLAKDIEEGPLPPLVFSKTGETVYLLYAFASLRQGDTITLKATPASGGAPVVLHADVRGAPLFRTFNWRFYFPMNVAGSWTLVLAVNDEVMDRRSWLVTPR